MPAGRNLFRDGEDRRNDVTARPTGPVSPRFAGRLPIWNPTPATIAAARAAGVMVDPAVDAEWVSVQMQKRARHQETLADKGLMSPARALREERRSLELAARARGIRSFRTFATDADAVSWLKARLAPRQGGDAA